MARADAAIAGGAESVTIHVAPGTYDISGDDASLLLQHTVTLGGDPSDPSKVVILNNSTTHRSVTLNHASAALKGVTLDRTTSEAAYFAAWNAAGHVNLAQGLLEDCVVRGAVLGNASATTAQGANVYVSGGVVRRCTVPPVRCFGGSPGELAAPSLCVLCVENTAGGGSPGRISPRQPCQLSQFGEVALRHGNPLGGGEDGTAVPRHRPPKLKNVK